EALGTVSDDDPVLVGAPLLNDIADDERQAAVGQVDGVARSPVAFIHDAVVRDVAFQRPALDVMADDGVVRIAIPQREAADRTDVKVVALSVAEAVVGKLRMLDDDLALRIGACKDAVLVMVEVAAAHEQSGSFLTDSGAVAIRHPRTRQLE